MNIVSVVGARPNFVKLGPVVHALRRRPGVRHVVVHTGQHYDPMMSDSFFADLDIPVPDHNLEIGSGSHAAQTAAVLERLEPLCLALRPDWVLVYGDVNSTMAAALTAVKLGIRVAHVEAGLRSYDRSMPEEHNRVMTDHLSDMLFTPSRDAGGNLSKEGIPAERVEFVGNVMIDSLVRVLPRARAMTADRALGVTRGRHILVTLHRPSNVDDPSTLARLWSGLVELGRERPVVFPMHPRTRSCLQGIAQLDHPEGVRILGPVSYLEMVSLTDAAAMVITDSGGLQEETSFLGVPCFTVRQNTERPITLSAGTNQLVAPTREGLLEAVSACNRPSEAPRIERWDGQAAERLVSALVEGAHFS